ncbi:MAG TPA: TIGR03086 family metal-binding protein [Acidimicrobiales bacterium]
MNTIEQLEVIVDDLQRLAANVRPDQFGNETPCTKFAVRDLFTHMIGGAGQFAPQLRGLAAPESPPAGLDDAALPGALRAALDDLLDAAKAPGAYDRTVTLPFGQVSGEVLVRFVTVDGMVHASDMARSTGQAYAPAEELAGEVLATARDLIQPAMRDGDTFAPETPVAGDASNLTRLVAFTGRAI